jgi:hypothetical protein
MYALSQKSDTIAFLPPFKKGCGKGLAPAGGAGRRDIVRAKAM